MLCLTDARVGVLRHALRGHRQWLGTQRGKWVDEAVETLDALLADLEGPEMETDDGSDLV